VTGEVVKGGQSAPADTAKRLTVPKIHSIPLNAPVYETARREITPGNIPAYETARRETILGNAAAHATTPPPNPADQPDPRETAKVWEHISLDEWRKLDAPAQAELLMAERCPDEQPPLSRHWAEDGCE
jgi:hypothetical protein